MYNIPELFVAYIFALAGKFSTNYNKTNLYDSFIAVVTRLHLNHVPKDPTLLLTHFHA